MTRPRSRPGSAPAGSGAAPLVPDHVSHAPSMDHLTVAALTARIDYFSRRLEETRKATIVTERTADWRISTAEEDLRERIFDLQADTRKSTILRFVDGPVGRRSMLELESPAIHPDEPGRELAAAELDLWSRMLRTPPTPLFANPSGVDPERDGAKAAELHALVSRALAAIAAFVSLHNPDRHGDRINRITMPIMHRSGSITDEKGNPILAKPVETAIMSALPTVAIVSPQDDRHARLTSWIVSARQSDSLPQTPEDMLRALSWRPLPEVPYPLRQAGLTVGRS